MPVTINVNKLSLCHQGSDGLAVASLPDVCLTPPLGVPVPYPNVAFSKDLAQGTTTVFADGGNSCAVGPSTFAPSVGDEAGAMGGVVSGTFAMEASWLTFSADVKIEGQAACRLTDKMLQNHGNTVCCGGEAQPPVHTFGPIDDGLVRLYIKKFMDEGDGDVCKAFDRAETERNGGDLDGVRRPSNCYDTNLAAAEHYLYARCQIAKGDSALYMLVQAVGYDVAKRLLYAQGFVSGLPFALLGDSDAPSDLGNAFMNILRSLECPVTPPSTATVGWAAQGVFDQMAADRAPKETR